MPKLLHPKNSPTPSALSQLQDRISKFVQKSNNNSKQESPQAQTLRQVQAQPSLFDKLQEYDRIVGDLNVDRTDDTVLLVFGQLLGSCVPGIAPQAQGMGNGRQQHRNLMGNFSSPTHNKKQLDKGSSIEDPQLFSFSKARKQSTHKSSHLPPSKNIYNSDRSRYSAHLVHPNAGKVSQFNSQILDDHHGQDTKVEKVGSLHHLAAIVRRKLLIANFDAFVRVCRKSIGFRKQTFKNKSAQYFYQLKQTKRVIQCLRQLALHTKNVLAEHQKHRNRSKTGAIFSQWHAYATRPEEDRIREGQVATKKTHLIITLGFRQFARNTRDHWQNYGPSGQQAGKLSAHKIRQCIIRQNKQKSGTLRKYLAVSGIKHNHTYRKQLKNRQKELTNFLRNNNMKILIKMLQCFVETYRLKHERLGNQVNFRANAIRFIARLRNQYHFQRAYWDNSGSPECESKDEVHNVFILPAKYQKIMLIYEILDCACHSLTRKGYGLQSLSMPQLRTHPAYLNYYNPHKLRQCWEGLKKVLLTDPPQKINKVKYGIIGSRVITGLLRWYGGNLSEQVAAEAASQKQEELRTYLQGKRSQQFLLNLEKEGKFRPRTQAVAKQLKSAWTIKSLMALKTYKISKMYYRKVILHSVLRRDHRIVESYFLEWKLMYVENVQNRLLHRDLQQVRKKYAMRALRYNINTYGPIDRLHRRKCSNLHKNRIHNYGDLLLMELRKERQSGLRQRKASKLQFTNHCSRLSFVLEARAKSKFLSELMQNWYQCRLVSELTRRIDQEYQQKLLRKSMLALRQMRETHQSQKLLVERIEKSRHKKIKEIILQIWIEKVIEKLRIGRLADLARVYWLRTLVDKLSRSTEGERQ